VVYRDVTRQAKGLYRLKHVGALRGGITYLSQCNSGWFCHRYSSSNSTPDVVLGWSIVAVYDISIPFHRVVVHYKKSFNL
jgi:hypothetical protein